METNAAANARGTRGRFGSKRGPAEPFFLSVTPVGVLFGEEAVDVEARASSVRVRHLSDVEEVRPVPADDVSPQGGETQLRARVVRRRPVTVFAVAAAATLRSTRVAMPRGETRVECAGGCGAVIAQGPVRGGERGAKLALPDVTDVLGTPDIVPGVPDIVLGTPADVLGAARVHLAQIRRPQPPEPSRQLVARLAGPRRFAVNVFRRTVIRVVIRSSLARLAAASGPAMRRMGLRFRAGAPGPERRAVRHSLVASFAAKSIREIRHDVGVQVHHHHAVEPLRGERVVQNVVVIRTVDNARTPVVCVSLPGRTR